MINSIFSLSKNSGQVNRNLRSVGKGETNMKKTFCVLLSALLLLGAMSCMLTAASAASYITAINLRGVNVPMPDRSGDYNLEYESTYKKLTQYDDGEVRVNGVGWMDVTGNTNRLMDQYELFQAGHTYRVTVLLEANSGYQFKNGVAAYVNGNRASTYEVNGDDGDCQYIGVTYTFPVCEYSILSSVGVTNVPLPRAGQKAVDCTDVIQTASGDYYVNMFSWYRIDDMGEEMMLSATDKFESSTAYRAEIYVRAATGFKFKTTDDMPDVQATVNGEQAEQRDIIADNVVCLLYDFYIPHPVTTVAVYGLDTPVAGAVADTAVTTYADSGYKVTKIEWFDSTDPLNNIKVTRFEAGKTYTVEITLTAIGNNSFYVDEDGYQDVDCIINGYKASSYSSQENDVVIMYKHWELPDENALLKLKAGSGYVADHENRICTILAEQSKAAVSANIENEFYAIADANKEYVGTGSSVQVLSGAQDLLSEYTVLVRYDVDGDGKITSGDARLALRASVGLETLNGIFAQAADASGDGELQSGDARLILRKSVGLD